MSRQIERAVARREYTDFCRTWARERRMAGNSVHVPRPSFKEWIRERERRANLPVRLPLTPVVPDRSEDKDPWEEDEL